MLAVDTNVVVRYLTGDDAKQSPIARRLVDGQAVLVLSTVLVECEWVLRGAYRFEPSRIAALLLGFAGLPTVALAQPTVTALALDWYRQGMDFADAIHLAATLQSDCESFATFDRKLATAARKAGAGTVRLL